LGVHYTPCSRRATVPDPVAPDEEPLNRALVRPLEFGTPMAKGATCIEQYSLRCPEVTFLAEKETQRPK
jgi:hypothetical protein